jgi:hypothetical protein
VTVTIFDLPVTALKPHPEERRLRRVSKDEATIGASWFETAQARLLTMRDDNFDPHSPLSDLILRSGVFAASRRMWPPTGLMVRDGARAPPHHEG